MMLHRIKPQNIPFPGYYMFHMIVNSLTLTAAGLRLAWLVVVGGRGRARVLRHVVQPVAACKMN